MKYLICALFFLFIGFTAHAQDAFGGNPASVHWRQVNSDTVRIIYPAGMGREALQVALVTHQLNRQTTTTIGAHRRKVNIVFQSLTTTSNGFVALSPFRSLFFLQPTQDVFSTGSLPPHLSLAIHEYRHVQQYMNFNTGFSRLLYVVLGEDGQGLGNALTVPDWFFEGDAVFQETLVSNQGRGRMPSFLNDFKALWIAGVDYSWMKWRNGSFRSLVPDHYPLGYMLVAYGRSRYGTDLWRKVSIDAAAAKGGFYPLQKAIERHTGLSYTDYHQQAFQAFREALLQQDTAMHAHPLTAGEKNTVVVYQQASEDSARQIIARRSYSKPPAFYMASAGGKSFLRLRTRDIAVDDYYNYRNGKIVYTGYQPNVRWGLKDYNDIRILDAVTGHEVYLTHKARYFSPDISADGQQVVAVQVLPNGDAALHLLNVSEKGVPRALPNPDHYLYITPRFTPADTAIVSAVRDTLGRMSLVTVNRQTGEGTLLLPFTYNVLSTPVQSGDTVFFSAMQGQGDQLMAYIEKDGQLFQLTEGIRSHYMPAVAGGQLMWTTPTVSGQQLFQAPIAQLLWRPVNTAAFSEVAAPQLPAAFTRDTAMGLLNRIAANEYDTSAAYHKGFHLFNFHSWRPYYDEPEWSLTLYGQNVLNTFQSQLAYTYNANEQSHKASFNGIFGGWYPWLQGGTSYTMNRTYRDTAHAYHWNQLEAYAGTSVQFNLTKGRLYNYLTPAVSLHTQELYFTGFAKDHFQNQHFTYWETSLSWSSQAQKATQQIYPHWANAFSVVYDKNVSTQGAWQFTATGNLYLPGLFNSHSLVLAGSFQRRDTLNNYYYTNRFPFSRGYTAVNFPQMWKVGANYHFPIAYPDWGFGSIVYFLRIRANAFYDYTQGKSLRYQKLYTFRSAGCEVLFDTKCWNQLQVTAGIRYSRLLDTDLYGGGPNQWSLIIPILF